MKEALQRAVQVWRIKQSSSTTKLKNHIESVLVRSIENCGNLAISIPLVDSDVNRTEILDWLKNNYCVGNVTEDNGVGYLHVAYKGYL